MAGRGPAPKPSNRRRRANKPTRGEWLEVSKPDTPTLPELPERSEDEGGWSKRTTFTWDAWRFDPASTSFGPSEIAAAVDLAYLFEAYVRGETKLAPEIRLRMDGLGLTPKGKRDLRIKVVKDEEAITVEVAKTSDLPPAIEAS